MAADGQGGDMTRVCCVCGTKLAELGDLLTQFVPEESHRCAVEAVA